MTLKKVNKKINPKDMLKTYYEEIHTSLDNDGVELVNFVPNEVGGVLNIDKDYLELPLNVTEISTQELGEYLNAYTQQKVYLRSMLGYAEMFVEEARAKYVESSSALYTKFFRSKLSETAKEREVNSDPEVKPYFDNLKDQINRVTLIRHNIESIEDILFMLSREVSRRNSDFSEEIRNYNVGGR